MLCAVISTLFFRNKIKRTQWNLLKYWNYKYTSLNDDNGRFTHTHICFRTQFLFFCVCVSCKLILVPFNKFSMCVGCRWFDCSWKIQFTQEMRQCFIDLSLFFSLLRIFRFSLNYENICTTLHINWYQCDHHSITAWNLYWGHQHLIINNNRNIH